MNQQDALQLCVASSTLGAAAVVIFLIIWTMIRNARIERDRRENYVTREDRTIRHRI